jgi:1-acyl-sn-glycerol-3-phosphate acyltransferase
MRRMIAAAKLAKASGRPIVLFPEGTRVPHGERPELKAGLAGLYKILGLPVIPVALDSGRVWPRSAFVKRSGVVRMKVGEPIPPGLPREEIEPRVHAAINALNA